MRWTEFRLINISLLFSLLATCGIGCAIVDRSIIASASESQIPGGCRVTATSVPSNPYEASKIATIRRPMFRSSMWNTVGGRPVSDIATTTMLWCSRIKLYLTFLGVKHRGLAVNDEELIRSQKYSFNVSSVDVKSDNSVYWACSNSCHFTNLSNC